MIRRAFLAILGLFMLSAASACAQERYGEVYDAEADAAADIDAALAQAQTRGVPTFIVFGANWCHDSRGLAHRLETHEALNAFVAEEYELVFVDVGERDRNLDQMARFGVEHIFGTPTLIVADGQRALMNAQTVHHWRTVDNADPADIGAYLAGFADAGLPIAPEAFADLTAVMLAWPPYQDALETLQASDLDEDARSLRAAYYDGFARSMARRALGMEAEERGIRVVDAADLPNPSEGLSDLTEAVVARLSESQPDLVARADRELSRYEG